MEYCARPSREMDPHVGFSAKMPLKEPGLIVEPPVWVPRAMGTWKSPTAAPEPEDEPKRC